MHKFESCHLFICFQLKNYPITLKANGETAEECKYHTIPNITCEQPIGKEYEEKQCFGPENLCPSKLFPKGPFARKFERMGLKISIGKGIFLSE